MPKLLYCALFITLTTLLACSGPETSLSPTAVAQAPEAEPIPTMPQDPAVPAKPTLMPTPSQTPTTRPLGTSLNNPVEAGGVLSGSNGTEIVVTNITADAWGLVRAENQFNDPPGEGNRFYLVAVEVANVSGDDSINVFESDFKLIGENRTVYTTFDDSCGVIPDPLDGELFVGGRTSGNICFQIPQGEGGLVLIHQAL